MRQYRHEKMLSPADLVRIGGMFARGMDTKDIASAIKVTEATVYNHLPMARAARKRELERWPELEDIL
jgi:DNA-binding NarL/FixJ family response regulator